MKTRPVFFFIAAVALVLAAALLAGCATVPPPQPVRTPFERCMDVVGKDYYYTSDKIRAATWCKENNNGESR